MKTPTLRHVEKLKRVARYLIGHPRVVERYRNQEAAMQKLIMQQQQYEKEQKELQYKQFLLLKQKQQQQQLNSTYPSRSNSSSNINNSSNSIGKIPVVPRKSITPPSLKQQHSTTIINEETQSSYSNMKFPSSAPSSS